MRHVVAGVAVREAQTGDIAELPSLIADDLAGTAYAESARYFLQLASKGRSDEARALVADRDGEVVGFVLLGDVAGTVGTARLLLLWVRADSRRMGLGTELCAAAAIELEASGARTIVVEMPDDSATAPCRAALNRCGFSEAARVPDYYADGVSLIVLQRIKSPLT